MIVTSKISVDLTRSNFGGPQGKEGSPGPQGPPGDNTAALEAAQVAIDAASNANAAADAARELAPEVEQLKDDLAYKLSKNPTDWSFTAAEQKTACSRMNAVYDGQFELIEKIVLTEDTNEIIREFSSENGLYKEFIGSINWKTIQNIEWIMFSVTFDNPVFDIRRNGYVTEINWFAKQNVTALNPMYTSVFGARMTNKAMLVYFTRPSNSWATGENANLTPNYYPPNVFVGTSKIVKIKISASSKIPATNIINIYGVRA